MSRQEKTEQNKLTHIDAKGRAKMVDVSGKPATLRIAIARGWVQMAPDTLKKIDQKEFKKGDVLAVAQVAGIMAAKRTPEFIPMCHPLLLAGVEMDFQLNKEQNRVEIEAIVRTSGPTGVEIEALAAVAMAGLTIYDMCKAVDREMVVGDVRLVHKSGGQSGDYNREGEDLWQK
jgi:cyclic pyranopterin phosphate synthase